MSDWIVVRTQPRRERWAEHNIRACGRLTYCPFQYRHKLPPIPLFAGYVFMELRDGLWYFLKGTFGVLYPLMDGENPAIAHQSVIDQLQRRQQSDGLIHLSNPPTFARGQKVRVSKGPMQGMFGIYQGMGQQEREQVLFELMGRKIPTTLDVGVLEAA